MQRVPTRQHRTMPNQRNRDGNRQNGGEASPALLLARRIREEQGVEQLKSFLKAVEPFVAPNELRTISSGFGINFDALTAARPGRGGNAGMTNGGGAWQTNAGGRLPNMPGAEQMQGMTGDNRFRMLQTLMSMQELMKGGKPDMSGLLKMMGGGR